MRILKISFCILLLSNVIFNDENKTDVILKIDTEIGQRSGFLKYEGKHFNEKLIILSHDIGSAIPTQELRIYKSSDNIKYTEIFNIPFQKHRGFLCKTKNDKLEIYILDNFKVDDPKLFITIDLKLLLIEESK